mmetsp:Transcript_1620/g.2570  ORF Transcript_1620/g.2570 Transcript_1620/m.2570 type:complete len:354 (-) Transcript_1620:233-1294(-)
MIRIHIILPLVLHAVSAYDSIPLDDLSLNREAVALSDESIEWFPYSEFGFVWNEEDGSTLSWRPQGITSVFTSSGRELLVVSWYGREQEGYDNRGVRLSFVDYSDINNILYRHVLLVDEDYRTFEGMHGGGLFAVDDLIHVPDSRSGTKKVYTFSINSVLYIPENDRERFYNYVYIIPRTSSYDVPITPSFLSYDWDRNQALVGTFYKCSDYHVDSPECLADMHNTLVWYDIGMVNASTPSCAPFFSEMQGAVSSVEASDPENILLWSTSSYGSGHKSHLHSVRLPSDACNDGTLSIENYSFVQYPPGLEDMHIPAPRSVYTNYMWMLTEFGANDGTGNSRTVFVTNVKYLLP